MKALPLFIFGIFQSFAGWAAGSDAGFTQLNHRAFAAAEGTPGFGHALAQTSDGILWIGGGTGLTRFDGVRFVPYPEPWEEPLHSTDVNALAAAPDGGLWIGFRSGGVSFLKNGHVRDYPAGADFPNGHLKQLSWDRDGTLWAAVWGATNGGLVHFDGSRWERVAVDCSPSCWGALVDRHGTVWAATSHALLARPAGETRFREVFRMEFGFDTALSPLAEAPDGKIWAAGHQLVRIDQPATLEGSTVIMLRGVSGTVAGPLALDKEGNLWICPWNNTAVMSTVLRVPARELAREGGHELTVVPEVFDVPFRGLYASVIFEDRETNIWVGTSTALHRFSRSNIVRENEQMPCQKPAIAAGEAGALWVACRAEPATVTELHDGTIVSQQKTPTFTAAYRDAEGTVWFAGDTALGQIKQGRVALTQLPPELQGNDAQALVRDSDGALWLSISGKGVFRYLNGVWSQPNEAVKQYALVEVTDDDGTLWFGNADNRVVHLRGATAQVFDATQGLAVGAVQSILARDGKVWVGGDQGIDYLDHGRFVPVRNASGPPFRGVSGIVDAHAGDLWLNTIDGIERISGDEILRHSRDPASPVRSTAFNYLDGAGPAIEYRPLPSAIEGTDGRLWFLVGGGPISIDVSRAVRNTLPPPVRIWSLSAGLGRFADLEREVKLPINTTNLQIDYSAGSLTAPERVQFRYKLEGFDRGWQDVGTRRAAYYTNLGPGHYTFHVIASNNDGVWNTQGAAFSFLIPPAFYQTRWFYALCGIAGVALLGFLYRVRVRQVAAQVRGRLEARLAERERIARELHDTLLQGMQGLIWRFQAATHRIPPDEPARQLMEQSLDRADKLLEESRDKVKDLRPSACEMTDLAQAFATEGEHLTALYSARFGVTAQGDRRDLHPIVREEAFLIGREALGNASRHADAKNIEVEVTYGEAELRVRVRDDGRGIGKLVLEAGGTPGHFGLVGMRERAKKLGGDLRIWSKPDAGTEIDLSIPARVAYRPVGRHSRVRSLLVILRRSAQRG